MYKQQIYIVYMYKSFNGVYVSNFPATEHFTHYVNQLGEI